MLVTIDDRNNFILKSMETSQYFSKIVKLLYELICKDQFLKTGGIIKRKTKTNHPEFIWAEGTILFLN